MNNFFYFVRHGETDWNCRRLCQGGRDISLNETGKKQSITIADKIKNNSVKIDLILHSPLKRAVETTFLIQRNISSKTKTIALECLKERAFGVLEGMPNDLMYAVEAYEKNRNCEISTRLELENILDFNKRVKFFIEKLYLYLQENKNVLVVSHGRVFNQICESLGTNLINQVEHEKLIKFVFYEKKWDFYENS